MDPVTAGVMAASAFVTTVEEFGRLIEALKDKQRTLQQAEEDRRQARQEADTHHPLSGTASYRP